MKLKISLIQFLTSLLAFITQVVLLRKIGPTLELDVFYIIFGYTVGLVGVISVSATFLVPSILNAKEKTKKIVYSGNIIIGLSIISLMLVCFGISIIITANLTPLVNLKEEKYYYIIIFLCISACATVITSAASAILNLYGRLYITALSTSATPIFALVYLCIVTDPLIHEMCFFQMLGILGQSICLLYYGRFY